MLWFHKKNEWTKILRTDSVDNSVEKVMKPKRTKKNFQCKECNKSFRDNYKLKRHEKVHMKMKLPEKTLDGQNLGEAYDSYLKGNLFRGIADWSVG